MAVRTTFTFDIIQAAFPAKLLDSDDRWTTPPTIFEKYADALNGAITSAGIESGANFVVIEDKRQSDFAGVLTFSVLCTTFSYLDIPYFLTIWGSLPGVVFMWEVMGDDILSLLSVYPGSPEQEDQHKHIAPAIERQRNNMTELYRI